jgi:hypothetical protein
MIAIENYNAGDISMDFIYGEMWDCIVLNKKVNVDGIKQYWQDVKTNLEHLRFNFIEHQHYIKDCETYNDEVGYRTNNSDNKFHNVNLGDKRKISTYTFAWPVQRNIPLPPPWAADIDLFPELHTFIGKDNKIQKDIDTSTFVMLDQYMFGEFKNIWDEWGKDYLVNPRISMHEPDMTIPLHIDGYTCRIHIPMTEDSSYFYWGNRWDRSYKFKVGNIYLINSHTIHGTTNEGSNIRANILSSVDNKKILSLLQL